MSTHATLLKITGKLLQSHKYLSLNKAKDRVRKLFEFNKSVIERTNNYTKKLFRNDSSHKLCVHIERENLLEMGQATGLYLTEQLIAFIYKTLKKRTKNISIVLIGRDTNFLNMVRGVEGLPLYISEVRNRGVELNFAISNCNSFLITASTSKKHGGLIFNARRKPNLLQ
uniref:Uncharacterized protein n=1 Tax=Meloidogyne enterolobii TaxID=390850 RepID=A0A6V7YAL6_MELEN|nr:unnamed protein product [Meloidogyne enterolobii]